MVEVSGPTKKDIQNKPSVNADPPSTTASSTAVRPQKVAKFIAYKEIFSVNRLDGKG